MTAKSSKTQKSVSFFSLMRFSSPKDRLCLFFGFLVAIITGFSWNLLTIAFGDAVDVFVRFEHARRQHDVQNNTTRYYNITRDDFEHELEFSREMHYYSISLFVLWIFNTLLNSLLLILFPISASNQIQTIKKLYFRSLLRQEMPFFDKMDGQSGEFASRVTTDLKRVEDGLGEKLGLAVYHVSTAFIAIGTALLYGWRLTLIILSLLPFLAFGTSVMNKVQASMARKEADTYSLAATIAEEAISSIRTVLAFNGQKREIRRYSSALEPSLKSGIRRHLWTGFGNGIMFFCLYLGLSFGVFFGTKMVIQREDYSLGTIVIVFWCVSGAGFSIGGAAPHFEAVRIAMTTAQHVYHVIDLKPKIDCLSARGIKPEVSLQRAEVELKDVHFRYPTRPEVPVLQGLSLKIKSGECVALVGPSGGGKSTVIQLLQRFYDPIEGSVMINGSDIRDWNVYHLRAQMATVGQEPQLFDTTIVENISFGSSNKFVDINDVIKVSQTSNSHSFISKLPQNYLTRVGDRATQLSGGQKQRIAIARALIKEPKILLLDEATSALDVQSEALVQQSLEEAARGRTTVIVAHRLTTIQNCGKIFYIDNGVVKEEGSHEELVKKKGLYYHLQLRQQLSEEQCVSEGSEPEDDSSLTLNDNNNKEDKEEDIYEEQEEEDEEENEELLVKKFSTKRLYEMMSSDKYYLFFGLFLSLIYGLIVPIYAFIFGQFVDIFANSSSDLEIEEKSYYFSFYYCCLAIVVAIVSISQMALLGIASERLTLRLRKLAFEAIMRQDVTWFDSPNNTSGALCTRLSSDAANVQGASGARMAIILQALSTFLTSAVLGFALNWQLSLIASIFVPLILIGSAVSASIDTWQSNHARNSNENSTRIAMECLLNIKTVQSLQKELIFCEKFENELNKSKSHVIRKSILRAITLSLCLSIVFLSYSITFIFGTHLALKGLLKSSHFFIIIETLIYGSMTVGQSSVFTSDYRKAKLATINIFKLIDRKPRVIDSESQHVVELKGDLTFKDIHFRYPSRRAHPVLNGLNLEVTSGQTVALVGVSGCGKSTSVQLLEKFYEPDSGTISIDGIPIQQMSTNSLRSQMALVSQEPQLFSMTIRDNIAYGAREAENGTEEEVPFQEVVRAAQMANIHGFISELPRAYDTRVGSKGTQLSGGQRQRLAIARALIRKPRVLLLDEATSALDSENEKLVQMALEEAGRGRTCLVIAHRLSTIRHAHKICVLRRGRIVEEGSHEELMQRKGFYFDLNSQ